MKYYLKKLHMNYEKTFFKIQSKVLDFYSELPFNIYDSIETAAKKIDSNNALTAYPPLKKIFDDENIKKIIDIGSGGGWFINSLSSLYPDKDMLGVDFNKVAVDYANKVSKKKNLKCRFERKNIFELNDVKDTYDFASSLGVLHHTPDCHIGIKIISNMLKKNSYFFLGLYHKYGREPFLDYFRNMESLTEEKKFEKFKELRNLENEKHAFSWFRDQVLHPHETLHTFEEINNLFKNLNFKIISTSINKFSENFLEKDIIELEKKCYNISKERLNEKKYYPGFFIILAQKC